jgi:hypothetical protein
MNQQPQTTSQKTDEVLDFLLNPVKIGDYVAECYQLGIRIGKVLKINEKSLTLSCTRSQSRWSKTPSISTYRHENLLEAIKEIKGHNGKRSLCRFTYCGTTQPNLINLTALNLLSNEIIENRV